MQGHRFSEDRPESFSESVEKEITSWSRNEPEEKMATLKDG